MILFIMMGMLIYLTVVVTFIDGRIARLEDLLDGDDDCGTMETKGEPEDV